MKWLNQKNRWLPTITFIPLLYLIGWLVSLPLLIIYPEMQQDNLSLAGTIFSFFTLLYLLPDWVKVRWRLTEPWIALGLLGSNKRNSWIYFFKGFVMAFVLIGTLIVVVLLKSSGVWLGSVSTGNLINAILLGFGVAFAEELIFRGWLLGELSYLFGRRLGVLLQALVFSLAHVRFGMSLFPLLALLLGLFLFGIVLALMRILDNGSIWSCIGFHGGLVGLWFAATSSLIELSPDASAWLVGLGGAEANPLGGGAAIFSLIAVLIHQLFAVAIAPRPSKGALRESSKGAAP